MVQYKKYNFKGNLNKMVKLWGFQFLQAYNIITMDGENSKAEPELTTTDTKGLSEVDLSSSEQAQRDERGHGLSSADDQLEFFTGGGGGHESGSGGESPELAKGPGGRDSDSPHGAFVTISPSLSPGKLLVLI